MWHWYLNTTGQTKMNIDQVCQRIALLFSPEEAKLAKHRKNKKLQRIATREPRECKYYAVHHHQRVSLYCAFRQKFPKLWTSVAR